MSLTVVQNLTHQSGDTLRLGFAIVDEEGTPANITGATVRFVVARTRSSDPILTTEGTSANVVATITNASGGEYEIVAEGDETIDVRGTYQWETEIEDLSGGRSTPVKGVITFERGLIP